VSVGFAGHYRHAAQKHQNTTLKLTMKRTVILLLLFVFLVPVHQRAMAKNFIPSESQWIIAPSGETDVSGQNQIAFDLIYDNADGGYQAFGWDITLWFDSAELTPYFNPDAPGPPDYIPQGFDVDFIYEDSLGASFGKIATYGGILYDAWLSDVNPFTYDPGTEAAYMFRIFAVSFEDVWMAPGQHTMATVTFDILHPDFFDSIVEADLYVMPNNWESAQGFNCPNGDLYYVDTPSTQNPDIVTCNAASAEALPAILSLLLLSD
jgi:hypothetical protein